MNAYDEALLILHESCDEGIITEAEKKKLIEKVKEAKDKAKEFAKKHGAKIALAGLGLAAGDIALIRKANKEGTDVYNKILDDKPYTKLEEEYRNKEINHDEYMKRKEMLDKRIEKLSEKNNSYNEPLGGYKYALDKLTSPDRKAYH